MSRNKLNLTMDIAALLLFAAVVFTGFSLGTLHGSANAALWGMGKRTWVHIHEVGTYLLLLVLMVHLLLHATWLQGMFRGPKAAGLVRRHLGQVLMVCGILVLVAAVVVPKLMGSGKPRARAEGKATAPEGKPEH